MKMRRKFAQHLIKLQWRSYDTKFFVYSPKEPKTDRQNVKREDTLSAQSPKFVSQKYQTSHLCTLSIVCLCSVVFAPGRPFYWLLYTCTDNTSVSSMINVWGVFKRSSCALFENARSGTCLIYLTSIRICIVKIKEQA